MNEIADRIKVIAFDVFGTVVDWHGSVSREVAAMNLGVDADEFALAWRAGYKPAMREVMDSGEWVILDDLHRRILDRVLHDFALDKLPEAERQQLNLVWHRLDPWPDSVEGLTRLKSKFIICSLSNGNIGLLTEMAKNASVTLGLHSERREFPTSTNRTLTLTSGWRAPLPPSRVKSCSPRRTTVTSKPHAIAGLKLPTSSVLSNMVAPSPRASHPGLRIPCTRPVS